MSWLTQKEGIINQYHPAQEKWHQPTRVVHHMIIHMFRNTHPEFFENLQEHIKNGRLSNEIHLLPGKEPISRSDGSYWTPRVHNESRHIELHESFLSYLWCISYSVLVYYSETIDFPKLNEKMGKTVYPISSESIDQARDVFAYARSLIAYYEPWDKHILPNPELYMAPKRTYVERTNMIYTEAVKFILCHEYTHLLLHVDQISAATPNSSFLLFEYEADDNAIAMMLKGRYPGNDDLAFARNITLEIGIVLGILAMFFFRSTTTGAKHPNIEDRLTNALLKIGADDEHYGWGFACMGLQLWDEQFDLRFIWDPLLNKKDQYYNIIQQIKDRQLAP